MIKRHIYVTFFLGFLTASLLVVSGSLAADEQPNIVYLFADEHRWCSMGHTEMLQLHTPNIDRLAREGISLSHCISNTPVCIPHRGMLIGGQWPQKSAILSNEYNYGKEHLGHDYDTIAQTFKNAGYATGYVGKWHLGSSTTTRAGFDFFRLWDRSDNHWDSHWVDGNLPVDNRVEHHVTEYNATAMTDQALEYLRGRKGDDKPFLLMVSWNPPHAKMHDPPPDCLARYKDGLPTRPNVRRSEPISTNPTYLGYHGHITAIDREIGRMLKYLEENRLEEDTVVIYSSDHGTGFGENGSGSKPHPFDEAIRVPFLVRWPGHVSAGRRPETPFGTINIYPTLCGLAGIKVPHHCSGGDLSHLLLGQPGPVPDAQLIACYCNSRNYYGNLIAGPGKYGQYPFRGIRTARYTYAVRADGEWILFDNEQDPFQMANLIDDPDAAELKQKMEKKLHEVLAKTDYPYVPPEWAKMPVAQQVAFQNEHWLMSRQQGRLDRVREKALAPYLDRATTDTQRKALQRAAENVFTFRYQGLTRALQEAAQSKDGFRGQNPAVFAQRLVQVETEHAERFAHLAEEILNP